MAERDDRTIWKVLLRRSLVTLYAALTAVGLLWSFTASAEDVGLLLHDERAFAGYTLLAPISSTTTSQRLPNGDTLICSWSNGWLFEVTRDGEIVWEYINPFVTQTRDGPHNEVFKVRRYAADYTGLAKLETSGSPAG